jgi:hypothetical protein
MNLDKIHEEESPDPEEGPGKDWGEASLLDIEQDLEELEEMGELEEFGDADILDQGGNDLAGLDLELDELEEYMDSHWTKLID